MRRAVAGSGARTVRVCTGAGEGTQDHFSPPNVHVGRADRAAPRDGCSFYRDPSKEERECAHAGECTSVPSTALSKELLAWVTHVVLGHFARGRLPAACAAASPGVYRRGRGNGGCAITWIQAGPRCHVLVPGSTFCWSFNSNWALVLGLFIRAWFLPQNK